MFTIWEFDGNTKYELEHKFKHLKLRIMKFK